MAAPPFSGEFEDYPEWAEAFQEHIAEATGLPWSHGIQGQRFSSALAGALTDDTLATVLSAAQAQDPNLLAIGERWAPGGHGMWQALAAIYEPAPVIKTPHSEVDYHVACDPRTHTMCPHCKVRVRRLLDLAQLRRWGVVFAELALDERLVNYLPEVRERPEDPSPERSFFGFAHWAGFHGDADAVSALSRIAAFNPSLETRRRRIASEVATDVARARNSNRHARVAAALEDLEIAHAERANARVPSIRSYETESRQAYAPPPPVVPAADPPLAPGGGPDRRDRARPDTRREAPYRWPDSALAQWPEGFRRAGPGVGMLPVATAAAPKR
jgi:hypothetical protein